MPERTFMLQVGGRHQPEVLGDGAILDGRGRLATVLQVVVRDQAALQGLLRLISDLGLSLVEVHESGERGDSSGGPGVRELISPCRAYDVTVDGPIGVLVEETLADHIEIVRVSTRYTFSDAALMGEVLTRLLSRGVDLEHATELPPHHYTTSSRRQRATDVDG